MAQQEEDFRALVRRLGRSSGVLERSDDAKSTRVAGVIRELSVDIPLAWAKMFFGLGRATYLQNQISGVGGLPWAGRGGGWAVGKRSHSPMVLFPGV